MKKLFLSIALIFISLFAFSQNSPEQITDKFFQDIVKETPDKTIDNLYLNMPWASNIKTELDKLKTQFTSLQTYFGKYCGNTFIAKKDIGGVFMIYSYIIRYERQPVRCTFKFYKPKDVFLVYSFSYDMSLEEELDATLKLQNIK
ncbi:MAG: hypothetical protein IPL09_03875 [Bacteroidetes bacterium]|nr:hypothetical protein [Bacteroidota bacterium]